MILDKNIKKFKIMIKSIFIIKAKHGPYFYPGFLSFGGVDFYTLISPYSPYFVLTLTCVS